MDLQQFMDSPARNAWIREPGLEYYVRKSVLFDGVIELATCGAPRGSKRFGFWRFLKKYAKTVPFYMEQVLNEDIAKLMRRMGWRERQIGGIPQFASPLMIEKFGGTERFELWFNSQ